MNPQQALEILEEILTQNKRVIECGLLPRIAEQSMSEVNDALQFAINYIKDNESLKSL